MIKIKSQISRFDIFNHLTEEEIFKYYIPEFEGLNKKFKSPFVDEKTPSCSIFNSAGRLFYKDFSSGYGGDCIDFLKRKYNLTESEAINVIAADFKLRDKIVVTKATPTVIVKNSDVVPVFKERAKIRVKYKAYSREGLAYWAQYGLTEEDLQTADIKEISHYWINGTRIKSSFGFAYNFSWYSPYTYKILQPNEEKQFKWYSNCPESLLQGYNLLPQSADKLFITSSYKDVLVLRKLNYAAVAPSAEGVIPKALVIAALSDRFKTIIPYMNNDIAGIKASLKYEELHGLKYIVNPMDLPKDPSDLIKDGYNLNVILSQMLEQYDKA